MSKSNKVMNKYLGHKFYKQNEDDTFEIIRIIKLGEFNDKVIIRNEETGNTKTVTFASLKGYTPLKPTGLVTFSTVKVYDKGEKPPFPNDVVICLYRMIDIQLDQNVPPFAVCRQSITDIFYNLLADKEDHGIVGLSVTRDDCPTNFDYRIMAACDEICHYEMVNLYIDDTLDNILECIDTNIYDSVLFRNFSVHMKLKNPMWMEQTFKKTKEITSDSGWCSDLKSLLLDNNFITDMNTMRNITELDFDISEDFISEHVKLQNNDEYDRVSVSEECMKYLSYVFKVNMKTTMVIEYNYDIDLADFNHSNYILLRDKTQKLYIVVYTVDGEYIEKDLEDKSNKMDFSDRYRLDFYNKFN